MFELGDGFFKWFRRDLGLGEALAPGNFLQRMTHALLGFGSI